MSRPGQFDKIWDNGDALLSSGAVAIANPDVTDRTTVFLQRRTLLGGVAGNLTPVITPGVGFSIATDQAGETSLVSYMLIEANFKLRTT